MLRITDFVLDGYILTVTVQIDGDPDRTYSLSVDMRSEYCLSVSSDIPGEYRMYQSKAQQALREYRGKQLPKMIELIWKT